MKDLLSIITLFWCFSCTSLMAQEMSVKRFEEAITDLSASINARQDLNGNNCALVKVQIAAQGVTFSGMVMGDVNNVGNEYWVYMPVEAQQLTVRHPNYLPLEISFSNYGITSLKGKTTYILRIEKPNAIIIENGETDRVARGDIDILTSTNVGINNDTSQVEKGNPDRFLYTEAGMNIFPFMGPNLTIGYRMKLFSAELGFTYGLNKTGNIYFYDMAGTIKSAYNYQALRVALRLGYTQSLSQQIFLIPQIGLAFNNITGKEIKDISATDRGFMDGFSTLSATFGAKLSFSFNSKLGLSVTPEYNLGIAKNSNYNTVKKADSMLKNWTDGFCLSAVMVYKF